MNLCWAGMPPDDELHAMRCERQKRGAAVVRKLRYRFGPSEAKMATGFDVKPCLKALTPYCDKLLSRTCLEL